MSFMLVAHSYGGGSTVPLDARAGDETTAAAWQQQADREDGEYRQLRGRANDAAFRASNTGRHQCFEVCAPRMLVLAALSAMPGGATHRDLRRRDGRANDHRPSLYSSARCCLHSTYLTP